MRAGLISPVERREGGGDGRGIERDEREGERRCTRLTGDIEIEDVVDVEDLIDQLSNMLVDNEDLPRAGGDGLDLVEEACGKKGGSASAAGCPPEVGGGAGWAAKECEQTSLGDVDEGDRHRACEEGEGESELGCGECRLGERGEGGRLRLM